ncbi:MAG: toprim domain-containing protein [bacterium]
MPLKNAKDLAPGRWPGILRSAGLSESSLSGRHGPCPVCGGKDRFRFADKGRGQFFCQPCGHGDGWKLLQGVLGCDFRGAADFVLHHFSEDPVLPARKAPADEPKHLSLDRVRAKAKALWATGTIITQGSPAFLYLQRRVPGLVCIPACLRQHPALEYYELGDEGEKFRLVGRFPVLLAAVLDSDGHLCNVHRTFLTQDGQKAPLRAPRKLLAGALAPAAAVRLAVPDGEVLGVAEGLETALSASLLFGVPVWSSLNANGLKQFQPPPVIKRVRIFADHDGAKVSAGSRRVDPGLQAARDLGDRLRVQGVRATVEYVAARGKDFNDLAITMRS